MFVVTLSLVNFQQNSVAFISEESLNNSSFLLFFRVEVQNNTILRLEVFQKSNFAKSSKAPIGIFLEELGINN